MTYDPIKTKAYKNAFYHMYVCPTSAHRGFRYGYRRYKGSTFTLKTTLFGWQNMISRSDLTLLNIKTCQRIHFCVIFLAEKSVFSMIIRTFATREPAKPLNDAQMCGSFFVYTLLNMASLIPLYKTV